MIRLRTTMAPAFPSIGFAARALAAMVGLGAYIAAAPLAAQDPDSAVTSVPVDSVIIEPGVPLVALPLADTTPVEPLTPRAAFIRSMIVPGWGQSAFGAYFRGGVFFAGWAGNWFMNFRNHIRLDNARDVFDMRRGELRDSLIFSPPAPDRPPNPDSMRMVLESTDLLERTVLNDSAGNDLRKLVRGREQQREDWIAWSIFWILASGVDGYVTAHLADFPATIDVEPEQDGGVSLRLEVPLGSRRP